MASVSLPNLQPAEYSTPELQYSSVLVLDPQVCHDLVADRKARGADGHDEVWEGVYSMSPEATPEHQDLAYDLTGTFKAVAKPLNGRAALGSNVAGKEENWTLDYRVPDIVVILPNSRARRMKFGYVGGPDFLVEVLSPGDRAVEKLPFYAKIGVREVLHVDRDTKELALFALDAGELKLQGRSRMEQPEIVASKVLPLNFQVIDDNGQPLLVVSQLTEPKTIWRV